MIVEPEIVKVLRKEENLGISELTTQQFFKDTNISTNKSNNIDHRVTNIISDNLNSNKEITSVKDQIVINPSELIKIFFQEHDNIILCLNALGRICKRKRRINSSAVTVNSFCLLSSARSRQLKVT